MFPFISRDSICTKHCKVALSHALLFSRNLESPDIPVYSADAHKEIINCIDGVGGLGIGDGAPEIVTGSRDGL